MVVTFDPSLPEYSIAVTLAQGTWPADPVFAITFEGAWALTIQTDRQVLSDNGRTLTVRDTGFDNVLDGLERNNWAVALLGTTAARFPLMGAAPAVREFRTCPATGVSWETRYRCRPDLEDRCRQVQPGSIHMENDPPIAEVGHGN